MAEEIRQNANKWTLEGDSKLLEFMEKISVKLTNHAEMTKQNLRKMELSLDDACISLSNTTNKFHSLQHSQFVENRVCEEDEMMTHLPIEVKIAPELNDMDSLQTAIDNGISMLNKFYEKVPLDLDDSDDEDDPDKKCHFFRPKDPYLDRATPFVIGSKEWKEKWHIGLVESEDESEEELPEEFSDSSDGNNSLSVSLNVQTVSESDGSLLEQDRIDNQSASPVTNNLPKIIDEIKNTPSTSKNVRLFPEEPPEDKTKKPKGLFDDSDSDNETLSKTQAAKPGGGNFFRDQKTERKTVNLFDDEPPELDFVPTNQNKPSNLFAESDDDDNFISNRTPAKKISIFDEKPPPDDDIFVENKISNQQPKKKVNLFDEDEFFSYIQDIKDKPKPVKSNKVVPDDSSKEKITQKKISNLFSDDVEDDLFDSIIKKDVKPLNEEKEEKAVPVIEEIMVKKRAYVMGEDDNTIVKKIPTTNPKISNIFDDLPPEDDFDIFRTNKSVKKKPNLFEDLSDEDSINKSSSRTITKPKKSSEHLEHDIEKDIIPSTSKLGSIFTDSSKKSEKRKVDSLFSDEPPEDDLFSKKGTKNDITPATPGSLFGDESSKDPEQDIFSKSSKRTEKPKLKNLFGDEPLEDDLFSQIITKKVSKPAKALTNTIKKDVIPSTSKLGSLFGDESSDEPEKEIFSKSAKKEETISKPLEPETEVLPSTSKLESLFGDEPPEDDLFSRTITEAVSKSEKLEQQVKEDVISSTSKLGSLFGDESSDEPEKEIFSKSPKESENNEHSAKQGEIISKPTETEIENEILQSTSKLESLFGDEPLEDDLFSKTIKKVVSKPEKSLKEPKKDIFSKKADLFFTNPKNVQKPEKDLTNVEQQVKEDVIPSTSKLGSLFSDESSDEPGKEIFSKSAKKSESDEQSVKQEETISKPTEPEIEKDILQPTSKLGSLFNDEPPEDDLFSTVITKAVSKPDKSESIKPKLESLFSDEPPENENDVSPSTSKLGSLLADESSKDPEKEIFSKDAKNSEINAEQETEKDILQSASKLESLFGDEPPEDDLFSKNTKKVSIPEKNLPNLEQEIESPSTSKVGSLYPDEPPAEDTPKINVNILSTSSKLNNLINGEPSKDEDNPKSDEAIANSPLSKSNKTNNLFSFTSKVLDEEIQIPEKLDEKIEEIKQPETKTPIISPQFNFLDEEPPSDPETESWSKSSYSTPPVNNHEQSHIEKTESIKPISDQSALNYPSIGLFDDLPPDDDDVDKIPSMPYTKTSHVYYDDTDLFLPTTNPGSSNINLLNDEPPPVDDDLPQPPKDEIDFKDKLNLFSSTPEIKIIEKEKIDVPIKISVSDLIQARTNETTKPVESPKKKIQPNKLNKNLSINVAALLPGAKRPSLKVAVVNDEKNSPDVDSQNILIEKTPKFNTPEPSNPDILPSLSKSRVKIQVKRRPSTRHGRQENYRKSIHVNDEEDSLETSDEKDLNKNKLIDEIITTPRSSHVDDVESTIFKKVDVKKRETSALLKKDKENNVTRREKDSLFSSDDDDPLFSPVVKKVEKSIEVISTKSKDVPIAKPILKQEKIKKNEKSIFGSEDDDDDLFGKSTQKVKNVKTIDKNKNNMFGDSDDDGEDIFSVKKPKVSTTVKKESSKVDKKLIATSSSAGSDPLADLLNK